MNKRIFLLMAIAIMSITMMAQTPILGEWITIDDKTNEKASVVSIYKGSNGLYYGKIIQLFNQDGPGICTECTGADKDKPIVGLIIVRDMQLKDGELCGGKVLDPDNGKFYYAKMYLDKSGKLVLRGSLDRAGLLGRSQTWIRK